MCDIRLQRNNHNIMNSDISYNLKRKETEIFDKYYNNLRILFPESCYMYYNINRCNEVMMSDLIIHA